MLVFLSQNVVAEIPQNRLTGAMVKTSTVHGFMVCGHPTFIILYLLQIQTSCVQYKNPFGKTDDDLPYDPLWARLKIESVSRTLQVVFPP